MSKFRKILGVSLLVLVFAMTAILATACGGGGAASKKPEAVNPETITYDSAVFKWEGSNYAADYEVKIDDNDPYKTGGLTQAAKAALSTTESIKIKITPLNQKGQEGKSTEKTFTRLAGGEDLKILFDAEGNASWAAINGASGYEVEVNNTVQKVTSPVFPKDGFTLGKRNQIRVRPITSGNATFSTWSELAYADFLTTPSNITYNNGVIQWSGAATAKAYEVYINESLIDTITVQSGIDSTSYRYDSEGQTFSVAIRALGDGERVFASPMSESEQYIYLSTITEFTVADGKITWPEVTGATKYEVKLNSKTTVQPNAYVDKLTAGTKHTIQVRPMADSNDKNTHYFSFWSGEKTVQIIQTPEAYWVPGLALDGDEQHAFAWNTIEGIEGYVVKVDTPTGDSTTVTVPSYANTYGYDFKTAGEYSISVKAVPIANNDQYESAYSTPIKVVRLTSPVQNPTTASLITSDNINIDFTIHLKDQSTQGATGFEVSREGYVIKGRELNGNIEISGIIDDNVRTEQNYTFKVRALGTEQMNASNRTVILSSLSQDALGFSIKVLGAPEGINIEGGVISWNPVPSANGYTIDGLSGVSTAQTSYSFDSATMAAGTYNITIRAEGNKTNILSSPKSDVKRILKLAYPENLRVGTTGEAEGKVLFNDVSGSASYELVFGANPDPVDSSTVDHINKYITSGGVSVKVRAVGNYFNEQDQIYTLTSDYSPAIHLTKLDAPTWPETVHDEVNIIWNRPANVASSVTPLYSVYQGNKLAYGDYNKNQFSLESFDPGEYTFYVRAQGDGTSTITSDMSEPVTVTKLESPEVQILENSYAWSHVSGAQRYVVKIEGQAVATIDASNGSTFFTFTPKQENFSKLGTHKISITSVSDKDMDSNPATMNLNVQQLARPTFTTSYTHECFDPSGQIIITATATDPDNTTGFVYSVSGITSSATTETEYRYNTNNTGDYTVSVTAVGGKMDASGAIFYRNSEEAYPVSVRLLATPGTKEINLDTRGKLTWKTVDGAIAGYEVYVDYGKVTSEIYTIPANSTSYQFTVNNALNPDSLFYITESHNYKFYIRAKGNGTNLIASQWLVWDQSMQN